MSQDYYKLLEVNRSASSEEIQKSYRRLARKFHPDLNPDDKSAQQKFKDIQHAYDVLNDPEKRHMYDQLGPDFDRMGQNPYSGAYPGGGAGPNFEEMFRRGAGGPGAGHAGPKGGSGFGFGGLEELFKHFGGGGGRGNRAHEEPPPVPDPTQGSELRTELAIPFNTAVLGGNAALSLKRGGKQETIQLKIPPGVTSGKKMRLRGQGNPGASGGQAGDLIVTLHVAPHPHFKRNGVNLELSLPITLKEAVMGATVDIPTPSGTVSLKIPPGSSGGRRLRVRGQGVFNAEGAPGDLYVELQIRLPDQLLDSADRPKELTDAVDLLESMYREPIRKHIQW